MLDRRCLQDPFPPQVWSKADAIRQIGRADAVRKEVWLERVSHAADEGGQQRVSYAADAGAGVQFNRRLRLGVEFREKFK